MASKQYDDFWRKSCERNIAEANKRLKRLIIERDSLTLDAEDAAERVEECRKSIAYWQASLTVIEH